MNEEERRRMMVDGQIAGRGVRNERVLAAMRTVPREKFVRPSLLEYAYADMPLPIDLGQTISQPYIVGFMADLAELTPDARVLEVGSGSGYAAAVLGRIVAEVYGLEWHDQLARQAQRRIETLGYRNVHIMQGDGMLGWPEHAPFDAIIVSAGARSVPPALREQLVDGGRLVIPSGPVPRLQTLLRIRRRGPDDYEEERFGLVQFVPLIGSRPRWPERRGRRTSGTSQRP